MHSESISPFSWVGTSWSGQLLNQKCENFRVSFPSEISSTYLTSPEQEDEKVRGEGKERNEKEGSGNGKERKRTRTGMERKEKLSTYIILPEILTAHCALAGKSSVAFPEGALLSTVLSVATPLRSGLPDWPANRSSATRV